jgi:acyl carrier protein
VLAMQDRVSIADQLLDLVLPATPGLLGYQGDRLTANLRDAGLSSLAVARLMLQIEAFYNVMIPDAELTPENFANLTTIARLIESLGVAADQKLA